MDTHLLRRVAAAFLAASVSLAAAAPHALATAPSPDPAPGPIRTRHIVQLADPPLAAHAASLARGPARAPSADGAAAPASGAHGRLDLATADMHRHDARIQAAHAAFEAALRSGVPGARTQAHYRVALNGLAVYLSPDEARAVRAMPGVLAVTPEERFVPLMDASLPQIEAPAAWADPRVGGRAYAGRGVRVAIIDTGITAEHPMFDDTGFQAPPGFPRASLTLGDRVTPYSPVETARFTNDKVIVARAYANPEVYDPARPVTPLADGAGGMHGAHVAGIAAGSPLSVGSGASAHDLSGVAPGAYLMAYKVTDGYTPELLHAIDDALADGADVINASWGTSAMNVVDPVRHPISVAFRNASAAGVVVVAAAGNAGDNGEATLGGPFQMIDEVITVGSVQTGRTFGTFLLATDQDLPERLERLPVVQLDMGNDWDQAAGPALASDLCEAMDLLRARGRIVLVSASATCPNPVIQLPIELPEQLQFLQSLLTARLAGALAVVLYAQDQTQANQLALLLTGLDAVIGAGGAAVPYQLPITGVIGGPDATDLVDWAATHPSLALEINRAPVALYDPERVDTLEASSSRGPAPAGPGLPAKPDLAAPGAAILSAATDAQGAPDGTLAASGTSMASPHVAGAAAVLRRAWPGWQPPDVKAALLTTADPVVTEAGAPASTIGQGAGRLNLRRALDPGLLVTPPSVAIAADRAEGTSPVIQLQLRDMRRTPFDDVVYRIRHEPGSAGGSLTPLLPESVVVPEAGTAPLSVSFQLAGADPGLHDGWIAFESDTHLVRVFYQLRARSATKDVLLLVVRSSATVTADPFSPAAARIEDTSDYSRYWTAALDEAGLDYDVWTVSSADRRGTPPLSVLSAYDLVLLAAGDGNAPLDALPSGMTALQMYLLGGGRLVMSARDWNHGPVSALQAGALQGSGAMYFLSRYFAGFQRVADSVAPPNAMVAPDDSPYAVLFGDRPLALSATTGPDAAGNAGRIDLGQPLAALSTLSPGPMQPPPDIGFAAPVTVEAILPYMRLALVSRGPAGPSADGRGTMTAVTADATLENPRRADFIPWRAAFAGFPFEAVHDAEPGQLSRAGLLSAMHRWAVEPADVVPRLEGSLVAAADGRIRLRASASSASGVSVERWRWDDGTGAPYRTTQAAELAVDYGAPGRYTVRVEAITAGGHTYVTTGRVRVGGLYVPSVVRHSAVRAR